MSSRHWKILAVTALLATVPQPASAKYGTTPSGNNYVTTSSDYGEIRINSIRRWIMKCVKDGMSDVESCFIQPQEGNLLAAFDAQGMPIGFCVLGSDFPGRMAMIRVEDEPAIGTDMSNNCTDPALLWAQVSRANTVKIRRYIWPYDYSVDESVDMKGFNDAVSVLLFMRGKTRKPIFKARPLLAPPDFQY